FFNNEPFAYYAPIQAGIPLIVPPDVSSGRIPLDRAATEWTPELGNVGRGYIQTWNVAIQRRLFTDVAVDIAYFAATGGNGYAALDINAPVVLGSGNNGRPYASLGRFVSINSWGDRLPTQYNSLQVALSKPFTHGLLLKGAYTLSKAMNASDNDGRSTLTF